MKTYLQIFLVTLAFVSSASTVWCDESLYVKQVKPVLAARCFSCHGAIKQSAGLRLDTVAFMQKGGDSGSALIPGDATKSLLLKRITAAQGYTHMPPKSDGEPLKVEEIALIRKWIADGAQAPEDEEPETDPRDHWAFRKPVGPPVPKVKNEKLVINPIDTFITAKHESLGLIAQPLVEKSLLLRRVYIDLTGLPPTPAEMQRFLSDPSPQAYEKVVDELLASQRYGERWGRHWMDIWRYSDWWGLGPELRNSQKHIWHWRDWIVESLNKDVGYDRMILEMLAADELSPTDTSSLRATGFLARHYFKFNRTTWLDETIEHTSKAFLGLTMNCAKCHDHKYDPISQKDYYRFRAIFEPYQIRTDQVPGEIDYAKNGIPRAFDCNLDAPTYLHIRGNEQQPNKDLRIVAGLPRFFGKRLDIQDIKLPTLAHQPGLRDFVQQNYLHVAETRRNAAKQRRESAEKQWQLALAASKDDQGKKENTQRGNILASDDFVRTRPQLWKMSAGDWHYDGKTLVQKQVGNERTMLTLQEEIPTDFSAEFQFSILGGNQWRSVGIVFDDDGKDEYLVYLTAHSGAPRVQVSYKNGANSVYPPDAAQRLVVPLKQSQKMTVNVRGNLLNVAINGKHAVAYHLPKGRRTGKLHLITFDAQASFETFALNELPASHTMVAVDKKTSGPLDLQTTQKNLILALLQENAAGQEVATLSARIKADKAMAEAKVDTKSAIFSAVVAERLLVLSNETVKNLEAGKISLPKDSSKIAIEKFLDDVRTKIDKKISQETDNLKKQSHTPIRGALKTLESNLESEASRNKPFPNTSTGRRSALARWIASRDNPLTARIAVNHIWARHFGKPLVETVFDFGRNGQRSTHPDLLDWLAVELMENNWSMKHIHRLLVTSRTYRMSCSTAGAADKNIKIDPDNRYLWHSNSQRLQSQVVRDGLLHLGGELDLTMGGPTIDGAQRETSKRRSMYFFHSAIDRNRFLTTFDEADPLDCYRRRESIVPQQALALANSKLAIEMAEKIAANLWQRNPKVSDRDFAKLAFFAVLCYQPNDQELQACEQAMTRWRSIFAQDTDAGAKTRAALVHALLNHNDFVTIR